MCGRAGQKGIDAVRLQMKRRRAWNQIPRNALPCRRSRMGFNRHRMSKRWSEKAKPLLYELLLHFEQATGCGVCQQRRSTCAGAPIL